MKLAVCRWSPDVTGEAIELLCNQGVDIIEAPPSFLLDFDDTGVQTNTERLTAAGIRINVCHGPFSLILGVIPRCYPIAESDSSSGTRFWWKNDDWSTTDHQQPAFAWRHGNLVRWRGGPLLLELLDRGGVQGPRFDSQFLPVD